MHSPKTIVKEHIAAQHKLLTMMLLEESDSSDCDVPSNENKKQQPTKKTEPIDVYSAIKGTSMFQEQLGIPEIIFDYILANIHSKIREPRNIHFDFSCKENELRSFQKKKSCYLTVENRLSLFFYQMKTGCDEWEAAFLFGTNATFVSRDLKHILMQFVSRFDKMWIRSMSAEEEQLSQHLIDVENASMCLDGKHFVRRRRINLLEGQHRKEYFGHKHKAPEVENVQVVTNGIGVANMVVTKVPGGMNDSTASGWVLDKFQRPRSILVDAGYPEKASAFIGPYGKDHDLADRHKSKRTGLTEHTFGFLSCRWKIVGLKYQKEASFHSLTIRACFILHNMLLCHFGGIHQSPN